MWFEGGPVEWGSWVFVWPMLSILAFGVVFAVIGLTLFALGEAASFVGRCIRRLRGRL